MKNGSISIDSNVFFIMAIIIAGVILLALVVLIVVFALRKKSTNKVEDVKIIDGVRCTKDEEIATKSGDVKISVRPKDFIMETGVTYVAKKDANLLPGKYTVLSSSDDVKKFNIRKGSFVREFNHGDSIVLAENERICAVSHTIILR